MSWWWRKATGSPPTPCCSTATTSPPTNPCSPASPSLSARCAGAADTPPTPPAGDELPWVYAGTVLVSGRGIAEVRATGPRSEIGKIGTSLARIEAADTPLHRETRRLVVQLAVARHRPQPRAGAPLRRSARRLARAAYSPESRSAMSLLPEEFPVVLAVFFVLGAWRIAQQGVLTRRSAAIETLGAATVLCTDKTGTLTQNRMAVAAPPCRRRHARDRSRYGRAVPAAAQAAPALCGARQRDDAVRPHGESVSRAGRALASPPPIAFPTTGASSMNMACSAELLADDACLGRRRAAAPMSSRSRERRRRWPVSAALDPAQQSAVRAATEAMAADGLRVLGVAAGELGGHRLAGEPARLSASSSWA